MHLRMLSVIGIVAAAASARSDMIVFDSNTPIQDRIIACGDFTYEGFDVQVVGVTVTANCQHQFASLTITGGGSVVHAPGVSDGPTNGMSLTILGDLTVASGSSISADGRGFAASSGPGMGADCPDFAGNGAGGGAHAGDGGYGFCSIGGIGGYASIITPTTFGSGGGNDGADLGGAGGGAIHLTVGGVLTVDGEIRANGSIGESSGCGGGAGGSVWVEATTVAGSGLIRADGGNGVGNANSGGGGGGYVAVYADAINEKTVRLQACGGNRGNSSAQAGGAGIVFVKLTGEASPRLMVDNCLRSGGETRLVGAPLDWLAIVVGGGARPILQGGQFDVADLTVTTSGDLRTAPKATMDLLVTGDLTIESGSSISADGRGFAASSGPGMGVDCPGFGSAGAGGGAHAGDGGYGFCSIGGIGGYGSIITPTTFGSGGGNDGADLGGAGGGAIHLTVSGVLTVDGEIRANGSIGESSGCGGGAGGSVWVEATTVAGSGLIRADGGDGVGNASSGGGGGGYVAVYADAINEKTVRLQACGGNRGNTAGQAGGAGIVFVLTPGDTVGQLFVGNCSRTGARTSLSGAYTLDTVHITEGAILSQPVGDAGFNLTVQGALVLTNDCSIDVSGRGLGAFGSPGAGQTVGSGGAGGGGYGGRGGNGSTGTGGPRYGDPLYPDMSGSGGGNSGTALGGLGGGALRLTVGGTFQLDGAILANGQNSQGSGAGGGSGGSVWIQAQQVVGSGPIRANGGNGSSSGGGGGGRVAVYVCDPDSNYFGTMTATGGSGAAAGAAGTVIYSGCAAEPVTSTNGAIAIPIDEASLADQLMRINTLDIPGPGVPANRKHDVHISSTFVCPGDPNGALAFPFVAPNEFILGADEVTYNNCQSAFYVFTFDLPPDALRPVMAGIANADDAAVLYLNGDPITPQLVSTDLGVDRELNGAEILSWPTTDRFLIANSGWFLAGANELVFAVVGDLSLFEPTGVEFSATLVYALEAGDCDADGDVDLDDYAGFVDCFDGPGAGVSAACECFDFNSDTDVDLLDFAVFQRAYGQ